MHNVWVASAAPLEGLTKVKESLCVFRCVCVRACVRERDCEMLVLPRLLSRYVCECLALSILFPATLIKTERCVMLKICAVSLRVFMYA